MIHKDNVISVTDFRKSTKVILDAAKNNRILLRRGDELYELRHIGSIFEADTLTGGTPDVSDLLATKINGHTVLHTSKEDPEKIVERKTVDANDIKHIPDITTLEQPCCQNEMQPCKHWVWDLQTGDGYRNSLSGRLMEVD